MSTIRHPIDLLIFYVLVMFPVRGKKKKNEKDENGMKWDGCHGDVDLNKQGLFSSEPYNRLFYLGLTF